MSTFTLIVLTLLKLASIWGLPAALWLAAVAWADRTPTIPLGTARRSNSEEPLSKREGRPRPTDTILALSEQAMNLQSLLRDFQTELMRLSAEVRKANSPGKTEAA